MSEYKSLEEAYAAVCKERDRLNDFQNSQCARLLAKVNDLEKQLHESKSEWISVNDRLPDRTINTTFEIYSKPLLFTDKIENIYIGDCFAPIGQNNLRWEGYDIESLVDSSVYSDNPDMDIVEEVTHWIPLPEVPHD